MPPPRGVVGRELKRAIKARVGAATLLAITAVYWPAARFWRKWPQRAWACARGAPGVLPTDPHGECRPGPRGERKSNAAFAFGGSAQPEGLERPCETLVAWGREASVCFQSPARLTRASCSLWRASSGSFIATDSGRPGIERGSPESR